MDIAAWTPIRSSELTRSEKHMIRGTGDTLLHVCAVLAIIGVGGAGPVFGAQLPPIVRGAKSVHILPDAAGPMAVTITKRDMRIYPEPTELTAVIYDPWQRKVAEAVIPALDRSVPAQPQTAELQFDVHHRRWSR